MTCGSGTGTLRVQLLNMRDNMVFYFFTGGYHTPVAIAMSDTITVANVNEPLQARLSLSLNNDPSEMLVTWTTKNWFAACG